MQEGLDRPVGQRRVATRITQSVVRVRLQRDHVDVHGQHVGVGHDVPRLPRGDVDRLTPRRIMAGVRDGARSPK